MDAVCVRDFVRHGGSVNILLIMFFDPAILLARLMFLGN